MARMDANVVMKLAMTKDKTTYRDVSLSLDRMIWSTYTDASNVWLCSIGTISIPGRNTIECDPWRCHALAGNSQLDLQ